MRTWLLIVVFALTATTCQAQETGRAGDTQAIRRILDTYQTAWNAHDAHAFAQIFASDAQFVNVRGIVYPGGRAGIEKAHAPLFKTMFRQSHNTTNGVRLRFLRPDVAVADVRWQMMGSTDHQGRLRPLVRGLRNMVLTKTHGRWQIVEFHNMEIEPPPVTTQSPLP